MFGIDHPDPFTTKRKVYAEGYRVDEVCLERPSCKLLEMGCPFKRVKLSGRNIRRVRRRMYRRLPFGAVPGYAPLCVDSHDTLTVDCAFRQRLLRDVPPFDPDELRLFGNFVAEFLQKFVPQARFIGFGEWLESLNFNEARKAQLRQAYEDLRGGAPTKKMCQKVSSFIKTEFYPTWKHGRMINSRSDHFKVFSGPLFKAVEEVLYQLPWFIKHVPVPERPSLIKSLRKAGRRYYITDYTSFEASFVPEVLRVCECQLYRHCLPWCESVDLLCSTISGWNRMTTRDGTRCNVQGRRMSGDMCTSLGNGFTNLMLALFVASRKGAEIEGFVEGDDGIFSCTCELTTEDFAKLGFSLTFTEVRDPCVGTKDAQFCGLIFPESGQIIRDPRKFLQGFGWTHSFINAGDSIMMSLLRAKALSSVYECPQCPIVGAMARAALRHTEGIVPRWVPDGYHHIPPDEVALPAFNPTSDTRQLFQEVYGVSVQDQLEAERLIGEGRFAQLSQLLPPSPEVLTYCSNYVVVT